MFETTIVIKSDKDLTALKAQLEMALKMFAKGAELVSITTKEKK